MADDLEELCGKISLTAGEKQGLKITEGDITSDEGEGEEVPGRAAMGGKTYEQGGFPIGIITNLANKGRSGLQGDTREPLAV
jgi:hypothetical protein